MRTGTTMREEKSVSPSYSAKVQTGCTALQGTWALLQVVVYHPSTHTPLRPRCFTKPSRSRFPSNPHC
jgi:hypothetical protein